MSVAFTVAAVLVAVAALLALVRVERGPSMLDRALGVELLASSLVGVIAIEAAWLRRTETIPILVALSLVGFVGSVVIARFVAREPDDDAQVDDPPELDDPPADDAPAAAKGATERNHETESDETPAREEGHA